MCFFRAFGLRAVGGLEGRVIRHGSHCGRSSWSGPAIRAVEPPNSLKQMEQSAPAYCAGMDERVRVGEKPGSDVPVPGVLWRIQRHVDDYRRAENIIPRYAAPESAVI